MVVIVAFTTGAHYSHALNSSAPGIADDDHVPSRYKYACPIVLALVFRSGTMAQCA